MIPFDALSVRSGEKKMRGLHRPFGCYLITPFDSFTIKVMFDS
jgi:hypothetical protein